MIERGTGRALIMDFGIARQERASTLTEVGQSIGTPALHESRAGGRASTVDGRSDLYSLGCVGFFAATGRPPFQADSAHKLLMQHLTRRRPTVDSRAARSSSRGSRAVIAKALEKEPASRYPTGEAMAEAIGALQLRSREVAPLLRLFHQQTAQLPAGDHHAGVVFFVFTQFSDKASTLLGTMVGVLFLTVAVTIFSQTLDRVRFAVRQGFTVADVRTAFDAIADEIARGREQLLDDPVERVRTTQRRRVAMVAGFLGGVSLPIFFNMVKFGRGGSRVVEPIGGLILLGGTVADRCRDRPLVDATGARHACRSGRRTGSGVHASGARCSCAPSGATRASSSGPAALHRRRRPPRPSASRRRLRRALARVGRAHASHGTDRAPPHPRGADQRAQLHQRLVVRPGRCRRAGQRRLGDRPEPREVARPLRA